MNNFISADLEFRYAQWLVAGVAAVPSTCALVIKVQVRMTGLWGANASRL